MDSSDSEKLKKKRRRKSDFGEAQEAVQSVEVLKKKKKIHSVRGEVEKSENLFKLPLIEEKSPKKKNKHLQEDVVTEERTVEIKKKKKKKLVDTDSSLSESPSPKKKKKSVDTDSSLSENPSPKKKIKFIEENPIADSEECEGVLPTVANDGTEMFQGWTKEDLLKLFDGMQQQIPEADTFSYNSRVPKLDWNKIAFGDKSAEACKTIWTNVLVKMRKYRLLSEILLDARSWVDTPWISMTGGKKASEHPGLPKKPKTAYILYCSSKMPKLREKFPELPMVELIKIVAQKYKALPEERLNKYVEKANLMKLEYKEKMKQFLQEHPSVAASMKGKPQKKVQKNTKQKPPEKPNSPFKLFVLEKAGDISKEHSEELKDTWKNMSDKKRAPWIRKAIEDENNYYDKLEKFKEEHPDVEVATHKSVITKEEIKMLERADGKPDDPPMTASALFKKNMLANGEFLEKFPTAQERNKEIKRLWDEVSPEDKAEYSDKVKKMRDDYLIQYKSYLDSLPEDKKIAELAQGKLKKMHALDEFPPGGKRLKQISIVDLLQKKKKPREKSDVDDVSTDEGKVTKTSDKINSIKQKIMANEPPPPPRNVFELFMQKAKSSGLNDKKILKFWNNLDSADRTKYKQKLAECKQKYLLKYRAFLQTLNEEEISIYQELKKSRKAQSEDNVPEDYDSDDDSEEDDDSDDEEDVSAKTTNVVAVPKKVITQKSSSSEETSSDDSS